MPPKKETTAPARQVLREPGANRHRLPPSTCIPYAPPPIFYTPPSSSLPSPPLPTHSRPRTTQRIQSSSSQTPAPHSNPVLHAYNMRTWTSQNQGKTVDPRSGVFNQIINGTKLMVLSNVIQVEDTVIDLCSGQSADMPKFIRLKSTCIWSIDGAHEAIKEAKRRQPSFVDPRTQPKPVAWVPVAPTDPPTFLWSCVDLCRVLTLPQQQSALAVHPYDLMENNKSGDIPYNCGPRGNVVVCHNALHYLPIEETLFYISRNLLHSDRRTFLSILCIDPTLLHTLKLDTSVSTNRPWFYVDSNRETETHYFVQVDGLVALAERKIPPMRLIQFAKSAGLNLLSTRSAWEVYQLYRQDAWTHSAIKWPPLAAISPFDQKLLRIYRFYLFVREPDNT